MISTCRFSVVCYTYIVRDEWSLSEALRLHFCIIVNFFESGDYL